MMTKWKIFKGEKNLTNTCSPLKYYFEEMFIGASAKKNLRKKSHCEIFQKKRISQFYN